MRITTFCFLMMLPGIASLTIQHIFDVGMTPAIWTALGFSLCACIIYVYARLQEVNE